MEQSKTFREQVATARQLEKNSRLTEAGAIYQKLFNSDPTDQQVIGRLLVVYRKLKEYRKELAVLKEAIAAYQRRQKDTRNKWIQSHPKAASAGKSMLRQLEKDGNVLMGLGEGPVVDRWIQRKDLVTSRITGKKPKAVSKPEKAKIATAPQKKTGDDRRQKEAKEKQRQREEAAAARKKAARERSERKAAEALRRKEQQQQKKAEAAQRPPSLFIIILRYLVSLEDIDAAMKQHMAYLDKYFDNGDFLVSGRQVPRTGGVILARAKDRNTLEKITKQDPFVKRKLASADIIEFTPGKAGKGLQSWLKKEG